MTALIITLAVALGAIAIWWLIFETEGVYLGRGWVIWLYDAYARRYERIKAFDPAYEYALLADPILTATYPNNAPLILDIATGTGRVPRAMCNHALFEGHIVALDLSHKMLHEAAYLLGEDLARVDLMWGAAECIPFADNTFDVVTILEALEFMADPDAVLREAVRVLRHGGTLLITQRVNIRTMPGKTWSRQTLHERLAANNIHDIKFEVWQEQYNKVWGCKATTTDNETTSAPRAFVLETHLVCQRCGHIGHDFVSPNFVCPSCQHIIGLDEAGIILAFHAQDC